MFIQQVAELQKENFGLKLRIYFLENRSKIPLGDNEENISEMVSPYYWSLIGGTMCFALCMSCYVFELPWKWHAGSTDADSGVETGGSGGSMNRGPELQDATESNYNILSKYFKYLYFKYFITLVIWHTCTVHAGFSIAGEVIYLAENTKSIKTLGFGGLHRFPDPVAGPHAPKPHLHS